MKKDMKTWAIKLRGRSFYLRRSGAPWTYLTKDTAIEFATAITQGTGVKTEVVRVRVRIEEVT